MDGTQNKKSFRELHSFQTTLWHNCFMRSANLAHSEMSNYPVFSVSNLVKSEDKRRVPKDQVISHQVSRSLADMWLRDCLIWQVNYSSCCILTMISLFSTFLLESLQQILWCQRPTFGHTHSPNVQTWPREREICVCSVTFVCVATRKRTGQLPCSDTLSLIPQQMDQEVAGWPRLGTYQWGHRGALCSHVLSLKPSVEQGQTPYPLNLL